MVTNPVSVSLKFILNELVALGAFKFQLNELSVFFLLASYAFIFFSKKFYQLKSAGKMFLFAWRVNGYLKLCLYLVRSSHAYMHLSVSTRLKAIIIEGNWCYKELQDNSLNYLYLSYLNKVYIINTIV